MSNINRLFNGRNDSIKFFGYYGSIILKTKRKTPEKLTTDKGLKTLTPKEILQRLPIAHAQVKSSNNSESLLNKIRQTIYSLYQSKEIT